MFIYTNTKTETWNEEVESNETNRNLWWKKSPQPKSSSQILVDTLQLQCIYCFKSRPICQYISRDTGILAEILVFYLKRYDKCKILPDIILDRYIATWPIYCPMSEMNISDISPRDAFEELLRTHLMSF